MNKTNPITIQENKPMDTSLNLTMGLSAVSSINAHAAANYVGRSSTAWVGSFGVSSLPMGLGLAGPLATCKARRA